MNLRLRYVAAAQPEWKIPLPAELEGRLTQLPERSGRFLIGSDVIRMDPCTCQALEVVPDVLR